MEKLFLLLFAVLMLFHLVACGKPAAPVDSTGEPAPVDSEASTAVTEAHIHTDPDGDGRCDCGLYFGNCGNRLTWTLDAETGILTVTGSGDMFAFTEGDAPWEAQKPLIRTLVLEDGVTGIGVAAFAGCENLTSVTAPASLLHIERHALDHTAWVAEQPDGVWYVGKIACGYKGEAPSNGELQLKADTEAIAAGAFSDCTAIAAVTIPETVREIGSGAFEGCVGLERVVIEGANCAVNAADVFPANAVLYVQEGAAMASAATTAGFTVKVMCKTHQYADDFTVDVPASCMTPGVKSRHCKLCDARIAETEIPATGKHVGSGKDIRALCSRCGCYFGICGKDADDYDGTSDNLTWELNPETGVLVIRGEGGMREYGDMYAADNSPWKENEGSARIRQVIIEEGVTRIGAYAFGWCENLTSISVPASLKTIGSGAFYDTAWYENQPDGLVYIGSVLYAYKGSEQMPAGTKIEILAGTTGITDLAFRRCENLVSIKIPASVISYGRNSFGYTFRECKNLVDVELSPNCTELVNGMFEGCTALQSIRIPEGVSVISGSWPIGHMQSPFYGCTNLRSIEIPASMQTIEDGAFAGCDSLTALQIAPDNPHIIFENGAVLSKDRKSFICVVPAAVGSEYTVPEGVERFAYRAFCGCEQLKTLILPAGLQEVDRAIDLFGSPSFGEPYPRDIVFKNSNMSVDSMLNLLGDITYMQQYDMEIITLHGASGSNVETFAREHGYAFAAE